MSKSVGRDCCQVKRMISWNRSKLSSAPDGSLPEPDQILSHLPQRLPFSWGVAWKATVLASKRHARASQTSGNPEYLKNLENQRFPSRGARPAREAARLAFSNWIGRKLKNAPIMMANGSHHNLIDFKSSEVGTLKAHRLQRSMWVDFKCESFILHLTHHFHQGSGTGWINRGPPWTGAAHSLPPWWQHYIYYSIQVHCTTKAGLQILVCWQSKSRLCIMQGQPCLWDQHMAVFWKAPA